MRHCDDIADDTSLRRRERRQKLGGLARHVPSAQPAQPTDDPVLLALDRCAAPFQIPAGLLDELAYGTAMDEDRPEPDSPALRATLRVSDSLAGPSLQDL